MDLIDRFKGVRVLVIGDVMLDGFADSSRDVVHARLRPGGAANAAANVVSLGGKVALVGAVGDDANSVALDRVLQHYGVDPSSLIMAHDRPTTTKIYSPELDRKSRESTEPLQALEADRLFAVAAQLVVHVDAVLLSDYGKGVFAKSGAPSLIRLARSHGKPVIVDPFGSAPWRYEGASILKPNLEELRKLAGGSDEKTPLAIVNDCVPRLWKELQAAYLTTCDSAGVILSDKKKHIPYDPFPVRVECDIGAGDSAAAALTLAIGAGMDLCEAASLANVAGAAACMEPFTYQVCPADLRNIVHMARAG